MHYQLLRSCLFLSAFIVVFSGSGYAQDLSGSLGAGTLVEAYMVNSLDTVPAPATTKTDTIGRVDTSLLQEITVQGRRAIFQRQGDKLIVNIASNQQFKTAANGLDILRKLPGVEVSGEGNILMAGRHTPAVFINGKPMPMSEAELQNYLASLSPDQIESIELNANPAVQYDAEHKAIINIRLKQDATRGWKGMLTSNIQRNNYTYADNNLLLTWKTRRVTFTSRLGYTVGTTIHLYDALQHLANTQILSTITHTPSAYNNFNLQLGTDYSITKNQQLEVVLRAYRMNRDVTAVNTLRARDSATQKLLSDTYTENNFAPVQNNLAANLNYSVTWKGTRLNLITSIVDINNKQQEDIQNRDRPTQERLYYWKTDSRNDIRIHTAQADLSGLHGQDRWTAGAKIAYTSTRNDIRYDTLNTAQAFVLDTSRTNQFDYKEQVVAGYISYEKKWSKFTLTTGLRLEHTHSVANAITTKKETVRNYFTWLPNISAVYSISAHQQLQVSLNRRTTRPNFSQLNPFRFYFSPLNYWEGNPLLQPSTTTTVSMAYTQNNLSVTARIGREDNFLTRYPEYDSATNVLQYLGTNLPFSDFGSVEVSIPVKLKNWWRISHNVAGYYNKEQMPYHGVTYAIAITELSLSGNHTFILPKGYIADIWYSYRSAGGNSLYYGKAYGNVDIGMQKSWARGRFNTKLTYYDVFNTIHTTRIFRETDIINNRLRHRFGTRKVLLSLSYSFGKSTYKAKQVNRAEEEIRAN